MNSIQKKITIAIILILVVLALFYLYLGKKGGVELPFLLTKSGQTEFGKDTSLDQHPGIEVPFNDDPIDRNASFSPGGLIDDPVSVENFEPLPPEEQSVRLDPNFNPYGTPPPQSMATQSSQPVESTTAE